MLVSELESALFGRFPKCDAEPWDHVGLSVGDPTAEVEGVLCSLDATVDALRTADEHGCNVLLTHHPVYIAPPDGFCPASRERPACSAVVYEAARLGISVISLHTNLDRSVEAREALAGALGITASSSIEHPDDPGAHGLGCLCSCDPVTLGDFAERAQTAFGTIAVVWGDPSALIERPAVLGGSLGDFGELALGAGADAIVTGEVGYHRAQDLAMRGMGVVTLGHDRSEQPFCSILADCAISLGVQANHVCINPLPAQWWVPTQGETA